MVKERQEKYLDALALARQEYAKRNFATLVDVAGATKLSNSELVIVYCGKLYKVNYPAGEVVCVEHGTGGYRTLPTEIQISDQIIILQYLGEVSGIDSKGKWLSFLELPGGPHHYPPFKYEAIDPLAQRFGNDVQGFCTASENIGGYEYPLADKAFVIPVFPKLKLAFLLWTADEEFPARANILFPDTAGLHLNTAGLYMLGINTAEKLIDYATGEMH